jgi:hypothetical protein
VPNLFRAIAASYADRLLAPEVNQVAPSYLCTMPHLLFAQCTVCSLRAGRQEYSGYIPVRGLSAGQVKNVGADDTDNRLSNNGISSFGIARNILLRNTAIACRDSLAISARLK